MAVLNGPPTCPTLAHGSSLGTVPRTRKVVITPILHPLDTPGLHPVRAMILPLLDVAASSKIYGALHRIALEVPDGGIWLQDSSLYHATLYHASSHSVRTCVAPPCMVHDRRCMIGHTKTHTHPTRVQVPVPASFEEVEREASSIRGVSATLCPIYAVLDRIIVTSSGMAA